MSWGNNNNFNSGDTKGDLIPGFKEVQDFVTKKLLKVVEFDDRVDQLNYLVTPTLLLLFATITSGKIYLGQPMNCLLPTTFTAEIKKFATDYCFIENVYFVAGKEEIPEVLDRESREFKYYQWVPYLLVLQAALFNLPIWSWKNHYRQSEGNPDMVMREARKMKNLNERDRRAMLNTLASNMWDCLDTDADENACRQTFWYIFTKILFILNIVLQFVLLGSFINRGYNAWCWNVFLSVFGLDDHNKTKIWTDAPVFPTDALCDFVVRQIGNSHRHTIQCMLTINQFNEKMFLFFSVYFLIVGIITIGNTISWIFSLTFSSERYNMVRRLIKKEKLDEGVNRGKLPDFVDKVLKTDGILLLHFIKSTAGAFVARDVCTQLFANYDPECLSTPFSVISTAPIDDWSNNYSKQGSRGYNSRLDNVDGKETKVSHARFQNDTNSQDDENQDGNYDYGYEEEEDNNGDNNNYQGYRSKVATEAPDTEFGNSGFPQTDNGDW
ncbi:innexin domain-containing protein [Ditylenchus destructor]|uniref:Innexin n=1 Tax=Ditylenchus destructor TaxID=166010 RepID=A0AAD4R7S0_9BILA|nr:innexin domain-containing protein [Ditylenchus destructor]